MKVGKNLKGLCLIINAVWLTWVVKVSKSANNIIEKLLDESQSLKLAVVVSELGIAKCIIINGKRLPEIIASVIWNFKMKN